MSDCTRRKIGTVDKRYDGMYVARIQQGTKADGTPRRLSKTFKTEGDARAWLFDMAHEMGVRQDMNAGITLRMLWPTFERSRAESLTKKTMSTYKWNMTKIWLPSVGDVDVTTLKPQQVQRVLDTLTYENAKHAKTALSSVLTWATREGILQSNPIRGHTFEFPERVTDVDDDPFADPFASIEGTRDVWTATDVLRCFDLIHDLPLEPAWLMCVGAGLRVEEALAIRRVDVRRVEVGGRMVTQLAVHAAKTAMDGRKGTKTKQSVRIVGMVEPMGERLWEIAQERERTEALCPISAHRQNKAWRNYFEPPTVSKHAKKRGNYRGRLQELPYIPLSKMRNTHVTMMAEAGVSDSLNALYHGHTETVERRHYLAPDMTEAAARVSDRLRLVI